MSTVSTLTGVPGMLRPFKEYLAGKQLPEGSQIVYYGCSGTCTPFVELLSYATRDLGLKNVFVPLLNEAEAHSLHPVSGIGMQVGEKTEVDPAIIIMMGGLAMPGVPVTAEEAAAVISRHDVPAGGVCFMSMFEKSGWLDQIDFELLIDATINPVTITKNV
ncbi:hypothetical protein RJ53_05660 [Methanocalculus chunghsingensis]|uniref:DUF2124 domain-containing protein n=1 Tax=Methanocalculus chunghsingensis TaxID=156457 RepID=A0A8J7W641_9EURY|nr:DUF2124 family protein [Methanocalculus chunghsingensis]MBR1369016.1 hypothetical protein [Methanocalculus chunghsingensis]